MGGAGGVGGRAHRRAAAARCSTRSRCCRSRSRACSRRWPGSSCSAPTSAGCNALLKSTVRAHRGAGQHLHDGRHDLGAVEPLFPARLSGARAGAARARRAHGGGRRSCRARVTAGVRPRSRCRCCGRRSSRRCCLLFMLGMSSYEVPRLIGRPGAHRRVHHRDPGRHPARAAAVRRRQRAQPDAAGDLRRSPCFSIGAPRATPRRSPPSPARATCRRASSSDIGVGRWRSASAVMFVARARAAAAHAGLAVVLSQSGAAVLAFERARRRSRTTSSS